MALTDVKVKNAKHGEKQVKLSDGDGMYLLITPAGGKCWRLKYRFDGKEKVLALGMYPEISLAEARDRRSQARKLLSQGVDPNQHKKAQRTAKKTAAENSFEVVAREWFEKFKHTWSEGHGVTILSRLEQNVFPWLGDRPIAEIEPPDVLGVLRRVEARGALETAHRVKGIFGQVFRYAIATGRARRDVAADLKGALPQPLEKNHAAITSPVEIAHLLRASDSYRGTVVVRCALQLSPLVFVRPGELRHAEWREFDLDLAEWNVPIERLKLTKAEKAKRKGEFHLVPLPRQALEILRELHPFTGRSRYVFTGGRSYDRCMSENAVLAALRRMGYDKDTMTGHGFRATARTMIRERLRIEAEFIEIQLAHKTRAPNGTAYDRVAFLDERRDMMQRWADYLDGLKAGVGELPIRPTFDGEGGRP